MILALTAACSSPDQRKVGEPVRVFMWMFGGVEEQDKWLRGAVDNFNAVQSGIRVEYETRDWATQRESLITSTIAGEGPDIIRVHHKYSVEFGELGGCIRWTGLRIIRRSGSRYSTICGSTFRIRRRHLGYRFRFCPL